MHRMISLAGISITAAALVAAVSSPVVSGEKEEPGKHFAGKILSIVRKSDPESAAYLEKVRIVKLDNRSFLVGTGIDIPDNWQKGRTVWLALDDIGEMTVFDTLEQLKKALLDVDRA